MGADDHERCWGLSPAGLLLAEDVRLESLNDTLHKIDQLLNNFWNGLSGEGQFGGMPSGACNLKF